MKFEDISTGGGCYGYYGKKGKYTCYICKSPEGFLPEKGEQSQIGIYDKEFDQQLYTMDIKKFDQAKMEQYFEKALQKYKKEGSNI